jgi:recombination protein RecT
VSADATREALARRSSPSGHGDTFQALLERQRPALEQVLGREAERFQRIALTEIRRNPLLQECEPLSVLGALMLCAQLDLEPGPLGHAYLVPYKREATFVLGYKGMIELANRSGRLRSIVARTVHEGDAWEYAYGAASDRLRHVPTTPANRGPVVCYYGVARFASPSGAVPHVMYPEEIEAARARSQLGRQGKGPWQTDYEPMAHKTVIRRMQPWLPQSVALARALDADERPVQGWTPDAGVVIDAEAEEEPSA